MSKFFFVSLAVLVILLLCITPGGPRAEAGGYGYNYGGHNYNYGYRNYFSYYPTYSYGYSYSYPTLPTYSPSYSYSYSYAQPSYSSAGNLYDGNYHYHAAGTHQGIWYPAGNYAWKSGVWVGQNSGLSVPVVPPDWKTTLLKVAEKRDEYAAYANALKTLGVSPPPPSGGFTPPPGVSSGPGQGAGYGMNGNANLGTYGANASTLYGYTYQSIKDVYGDASYLTGLQQASRLVQNAQALGGEATKQFQETVAQDGTNRARVAEYLAKAQAAATALRAAEGNSSRTTETITRFGNQQGNQQGPQPGQPMPPAENGASNRGATAPQTDPAFVKLATERCIKCHGPDKQEGKFDIRQYPALSIKDKAALVWPRLVASKEDKEHMPKEGPSLTPEELKLFFSN